MFKTSGKSSLDITKLCLVRHDLIKDKTEGAMRTIQNTPSPNPPPRPYSQILLTIFVGWKVIDGGHV